MKRVTQAEFARLCRVNRSTVNRWIKNGRIEADAQGLIDPAAAHKMRDLTESPLPHHQARKAQFDEARQGVGQGGAETTPQPTESKATTPTMEKLGAALKLETWKLQKAKAERENMELDLRAGALVERAEVDFVLADFGNTLRALLEGMADRLSPSLAAHRGDVSAIHREIEDTAHALLTEISDHMRRKMDQI